MGYTVLRWRQLALLVLLQRLLLTSVVTLMVVAIARWLINPGEEVWLVERRGAVSVVKPALRLVAVGARGPAPRCADA